MSRSSKKESYGISDSNDIIVDFSFYPFVFRSVEYLEFTNYLNDYFEFSKELKYIFEVLIPKISECTYDNVYSKTSGHSHPIKKNTKEIDLIYNIIKEKLKNDISYNDDDIERFFVNNIYDYEIWQMGLSGGTRIVGVRLMNKFRVLFFDYHHLIYQNKYFNQPNYAGYNFCPIKGGN